MQTEIEKRKKAYEAAITKLEKKRKSKIFAIVQNQHEHLCAPTYKTILQSRSKFKGIDTLEILIHSPGGHIDVAYQAIKYFRRHCSQLNVIVPLMAKSAATLLCLGADNIYMKRARK
jgi:ClpP class serine protease